MNVKQKHNLYCFNSRRLKRGVMIEVDIKTYHGHIFTCNKCNKFHFEFNQVGIDFSKLDTLKEFSKYLYDIDSDYILKHNDENNFIRKIHIPISGTSLKLMLDTKDLDELRILVKSFIEEYQRELKQAEFIYQLTHIRKDQHN